MLIEVHMLKNFPPTNLNRDDTGAPKTCYFGGVQRGRISSQCLKRSWRTSEIFRDAVGEDNLGIRTRKMPEYIRDQLVGCTAAICGRRNRRIDFDDFRLFYYAVRYQPRALRDGAADSPQVKGQYIIRTFSDTGWAGPL